MTKTALLAAAALVLVAGPAFAQSTQSSAVNLEAEVAPMCQMTTAGSSTYDINMNPHNAGSIVDADGTLKAQTSAPALLSAFAGGAPLEAWCNGVSSTITLSATGLTTPGTGSAEFDNYIDVALEDWQVDGRAIPDVITTNGGTASASAATTGVFSGSFDGSIRFVDTGRKIVAGAYTGSFTLTISAT